MMASTNLARRPFRNERLPWLLAGLLVSGALALSFVHGRFVDRLLSGDEARTVRLVREDEARIAELEDAIAREPPLKIETAELARVRTFKELIDRRVFPWGRLLSELEATLEDDVRLNKIAPTTTRGVRGMVIDLAGLARSKDAVFSLAEALGASPAFSNVTLKSLSEQEGGIEFTMEAGFDSEPPPVSSEAPAHDPTMAGRPTPGATADLPRSGAGKTR